MDNQNLKYLISIFKNMDRNYYEYASFGDNTSHINYLNTKKINYDLEDASGVRKTYVIKDPNNNELFNFRYPFYTHNQQIALDITKDKYLAEEHFKRCGFKTTSSKVYLAKEVETAFRVTFNDNENKKIVLKPSNSSLGKGVFVNVSKESFKETWNASIAESVGKNMENISNTKFIVQNILNGFEARATIMQGTLVSITVRIPPYVIGNGLNTIEQLILSKNKLRNKCRFQKNAPIILTKKIELFLSSNNHSINYIPKKDEAVLLSSVSNISAGGELLDITELVSNNIKEFALDVMASIPGMYSGGLDLIMETLDDKHPAILEANVYPNLSIPRHPTYGIRRNPSKVLFDSLISQYQIDQPSSSRYDIENEGKLLKNYLSFITRKEKYSKINYYA